MDKNNKGWNFIHNIAQNADWKPGLREIFDYRDLGLKDGTNGDYIAHIIKANGKELKDEVKEWHLHECEFQFVLVLNGWATFEYEGEGIKTIRKGYTVTDKADGERNLIIVLGDGGIYLMNRKNDIK